MKDVKWIYVAKFVAICAVLIDHSAGILYKNPNVQKLSYFSVSLFIILMGITSYWSYERCISNNESIHIKIIKKIIGILCPYIFAVIVYEFFNDKYNVIIDLDFFKKLVYCSASAPHYYVSLYIQLLIFSGGLFYIIKFIDKLNHKHIRYVLLFIILILIAIFSINKTNYLNMIAGGGKIFGGTYVVLLYIGMLIAKNYKCLENLSIIKIWLINLLFLVCLFLSGYLICNFSLGVDIKFFMGGYNPPGVLVSVYSLIVLITIYCLISLSCRYNCFLTNKIINIMSTIGQHTLFIFLFHKLFLDYTIPFIYYMFDDTGVRIYYITMMFGGSLLLEYIYKNLKKQLINMYVFISEGGCNK